MTDLIGRFGPKRQDTDGVTFRLWAPAADRVELMIGDTSTAMAKAGDGWFEASSPTAHTHTRYGFRIDGTAIVPDPASHHQPDDVQGPSEVIDQTAYRWQYADWRGRPWHEAVIYELHIGTFSAEGTFRGAIEHLDHLVATGITAIELMPVADFSGARNWGYDGVLLFAPDSAYGRPDDLKALIDAAHQRGLMVFLDVVYNHFGPEGNYLAYYAPEFFTKDLPTPWGAAIDYRRPEVRAFAIQNVLHWLDIYRFDGLRLDAIHAIRARGEPSILENIKQAARDLAERQDRHIHLILENDDNSADLLEPGSTAAAYRAQWNDDYHHAWHVLITGETAGYYEDYEEPFTKLRRALAEGFVYQGEVSKHRGGKARGQISNALSPLAFITFMQNHDQIGNRPYGDRLDALAPAAAIEAALAITLLAPCPPMLFMGEEWGCRQPFPFFCDFTGDLAVAVEEGRRREFAPIYAHARAGHEPPSALDPETFRSAKLDWSAHDQTARKRYLRVRDLLILRQRDIVPHMAGPSPIRSEIADAAPPIIHMAWALADDSRLTLLANLSNEPRPRPENYPAREPAWGLLPDAELMPWQVIWWLEVT